MKKIKRPFWSLLFLALLLSGCAGESAAGLKTTLPYAPQPQYEWGNTAKTTLTLWSQEPDIERVYMQKAIAAYEAATGNRIEIVQYPQAEFEDTTARAFAGETQAPDLLLSYGGANIDAYDPDENFYDFSDAVWVSDLTDTSINQTVYHGKIIGLPHWEASVAGFLYNKQIFERLGIKLPETQEEFMDACAVLLKNGVVPMYVPFQSPSMLLYQFPFDSVVQDAAILNALNEGELSYSRLPQMKKIVEWYKAMAQAGYFGQELEKNSWEGMSEALSSGGYAMMPCWDTWLYTDFQGDASNFGLMPAFMGVPDSGVFEGPNLALVIVNRHSEKLEAALDFVTFLADPYNYNQAFAGLYTAPVFKNQVASISTPQYAEAERLIERHYYDSTAWLRIRGFSQNDASCIIEYILSDDMTATECLKKMDALRARRLDSQKDGAVKEGES